MEAEFPVEAEFDAYVDDLSSMSEAFPDIRVGYEARGQSWGKEMSYLTEVGRRHNINTSQQQHAVVKDDTSFVLLVKQWHAEGGVPSSLSDMILCPSYPGKIVKCHTISTNQQQRAVVKDDNSFVRLVEQWRVERGAKSSLSDMILCPSYLRIIGMGEEALPLVLRQLKSEGDDPDHWFTALEAITGQDPVPKDAYGDTVKMAEAWLLWAKENNVR